MSMRRRAWNGHLLPVLRGVEESKSAEGRRSRQKYAVCHPLEYTNDEPAAGRPVPFSGQAIP